MKKIIMALLVVLMTLMLVACKDDEPVKIDFPFDDTDITSIEVYHRNSAPDTCEKITVSKGDDMQKIYSEFSDLDLEEREFNVSEYVIGLDSLSIRFVLADGREFDISFANQGNGGFISFTSGEGQYYTQADVISSWMSLKEQYDSVSVGMDEMP